MRRYLEVLRSPHLGAMFAASLLARLPIGINGLAIVLLLRAETGSFAVAGAAAGALALGTGIAAPVAADHRPPPAAACCCRCSPWSTPPASAGSWRWRARTPAPRR